MTQFITGLTAAEMERLALLAEECAEVGQAVCKILRHGYASSNPFLEITITNRSSLEKEIGHLANAVNMLIAAGDVDEINIGVAEQSKQASIGRWLHFQEPKRC